MKIQAGQLYHIYNQGNNQGRLFFDDSNYIFFLKLVRKFILPNCEILAYCLMPNHFHFLVYTNKKSIEEKSIGSINICSLQNGFRLLQSSYTLAFNKQTDRTGSLFRQKTRFKNISEMKDASYGFICFNYIHQNPSVASLCESMENWVYSSFKDYAGYRNGSLCNQELAHELLNYDKHHFIEESYNVITEEKLKELFI